MCATEANLTEQVRTVVALRQWVLTFSFPWRRRLAQDGALLGALSRIFVKRVGAFYAKRAADGGAAGAKSGAVTVVQRTSSDRRRSPHLHVVVLDGTSHEEGAELAWRQLGHLQSREVGEVLEQALRRMARPLRHLGVLESDESGGENVDLSGGESVHESTEPDDKLAASAVSGSGAAGRPYVATRPLAAQAERA